MPIHKYKVSTRYVAGGSVVQSDIIAYTAEDAADQVRIALGVGSPFTVIAVEPDGEVEVPGADPDRFFVQLKKALDENMAPMGTQEVDRLRGELATQRQRMQLRIDSSDNQVKMCSADLVTVRGELDYTLKRLARVCVAINPGSSPEGNYVGQAVEEACRLIKALAALDEKFDAALKVILVFEAGASSDALMLERMEAARLEFRQYHPDPE